MDKDLLHIYVRVSSETQTEGESLSFQQKLGINKSKQLGLKYKIWNEGGKSSFSDQIEDRPILSKLFNEIRKGKVQNLFVFNTDRLSRNESVWYLIKVTLITHNVILHTPNGTYDLNDPITKLLIDVLSSFSQYENSLRVMRSKYGKWEKVKKGFWMGGDLVYGYKLKDGKLIENKSESKWVKRIFKEYVNDSTINDISDILFKNTVKSRRGLLRWSRGSIEKLMSNTHYRGYYIVKNHTNSCEIKVDKKRESHLRKGIKDCSCESFKVDCPPLIDKTTLKKYDDIKERNRKQRSPNEHQHKIKYGSLLNEKLVCGECGGGMIHQSHKVTSFYFCKNKKYGRKLDRSCNKNNTPSKNLDDIVWDNVLDVLSKSHLYKEKVKVEILTQSEKGKRQKEIQNLNTQIENSDKDIINIDNWIIENQTNQILKRVSDKDSQSIINNLLIEKERLIKKKEENLFKLSKYESEVKWLDWYKEFGDSIDKLRNTKLDLDKKKLLLNEVIDSIKVDDSVKEDMKTYEYKKGKQIDRHNRKVTVKTNIITVKFNVPYIDDKIVWKHPTNKKKGYTLKNGKSTMKIVYSNRQKKTEIESITYGK